MINILFTKCQYLYGNILENFYAQIDYIINIIDECD